MTLSVYIDALKMAASGAAAAEEQFRRDILPRTRALERERAFAFRRLNFMNAIAEAVGTCDSEEIAVAAATGVMRARLGWSSDSEARAEVIERFIPVTQAMFAELPPAEDQETPPLTQVSLREDKPDVTTALADFESWYEATHPNAFWVLFENVMPETPVVDF